MLGVAQRYSMFPDTRLSRREGSSIRPAWTPLQPPAVALEARSAIEYQPHVDVLVQQRGLDLATQAAERERRHGRSQPGMRAGVTAALVEAHRDLEPAVAHAAPSRRPQLQPSRAVRERRAPRWRRARRAVSGIATVRLGRTGRVHHAGEPSGAIAPPCPDTAV